MSFVSSGILYMFQLMVWKSLNRQPKAIRRSQWEAALRAAADPLTPATPSVRGWFSGSAPLPMNVVITGMLCFSARPLRVSLAFELKAPPPAKIRGRLACRMSFAAASTEAPSGLGLPDMFSNHGFVSKEPASIGTCWTSKADQRTTGPGLPETASFNPRERYSMATSGL